MAVIGINAACMHSGTTYRNAGVSVYAQRLLATLLPMGSDEHQFVVFVNSDFATASLPQLALAKVVRSPFSGSSRLLRIGWEQSGLALAAHRHGVEVLHGLLDISVLLYRGPQVITVHDLTYVLTPQAHPRSRRAWFALAAPRSARRAKAILAVSEATGRDLIKHYDLDPGRLIIAHHGRDQHMTRVTDYAALAAFRKRNGLPERFLLFLGTIEPRKNLERLIRAFAGLCDRGYPGKLVIAGGLGWGDIDITALATAAGVEHAVLTPGYVIENEKRFWYSAAEAFVFPSLYEGFGLPVLEAMSCGTPVAVANISALPEVVGETGQMFDPLDVDSMIAALTKICGDPTKSLAHAQAAMARSLQCSWDRAAQGALAAYRRALSD